MSKSPSKYQRLNQTDDWSVEDVEDAIRSRVKKCPNENLVWPEYASGWFPSSGWFLASVRFPFSQLADVTMDQNSKNDVSLKKGHHPLSGKIFLN